MDSVRAYIGQQYPQNAAGAESAKLDFEEASKLNAGMSASGISTYLQHRVINDNAKKVGLTDVWHNSTATDRKHVDEVVGNQLEEWMTTSGEDKTFWNGGYTALNGSISPSPAQLEDMMATMADSIQSVVSQGYSTGMANQMVAEKFKEHLTIRSGQNQTTNAIEMNYAMSQFLVTLRNDTDKNGYISDEEDAKGPISTAAASAIMSGVKVP